MEDATEEAGGTAIVSANRVPSKNNLVPMLLGVAVAVVISLLLWRPMLTYYEAVSSKFAGALGILLGLYGLALTVAGFGLTWWQLARTQRAAEAVRLAIKRLKNDFSSFDILLEMRTARAAGEECGRHLGVPSWHEAQASYHRLRSSLVKMTAVNAGLSDENLGYIKDFTAVAVDAIRGLDAKVRDAEVEVDVANLGESLLELDEFLIRLEYSMRDIISGR